MSVGWIGAWDAELGDFSDVASVQGTPTIVTTPGATGTNAYRVPGGAGSWIRFKIGMNLTEAWGHWRFRHTSTGNPASDQTNWACYLANANSNGGVVVYHRHRADGTHALLVGTASAVHGSSTVYAIAKDTWYDVEAHYIYGASGLIEWRVNGALIDSLVADTRGTAVADRINAYGLGTGAGYANFYDNVVLRDDRWPMPARLRRKSAAYRRRRR